MTGYRRHNRPAKLRPCYMNLLSACLWLSCSSF